MWSMAILATVALSAIAGASDATVQESPAPAPVVRLLVVNRANLRSDMLQAAEDDAGTIYRVAGVQTTWVNAGPLDVSDDYAVDFMVMIVAGNESRLIAARAKDEAVGFAVSDSHMAFVLFDRVEDNATKHHVMISRILGKVIAHEVGHLLLPCHGHSDRGIMHAVWDLRSGLLEYFTTAQAEAIRQRLTLAPGSLTCKSSLNHRQNERLSRPIPSRWMGELPFSSATAIRCCGLLQDVGSVDDHRDDPAIARALALLEPLGINVPAPITVVQTRGPSP